MQIGYHDNFGRSTPLCWRGEESELIHAIDLDFESKRVEMLSEWAKEDEIPPSESELKHFYADNNFSSNWADCEIRIWLNA